MSETTLPLSSEDEADILWKQEKERLKAEKATGEITMYVRIEGGGIRRGHAVVRRDLPRKGRRG